MSQGFPFTQQPSAVLAKAKAVGKHIKASKYRELMWYPVASPGSSPPQQTLS